ncbi:transcriptional regulator, PadR-like family protein [Paenibacillus algicola]|uniref:Transcriptional regulator, PadR-like family protein n=1 Tax=Paenibacillus algicola TaxID=2565926 RepID=A0A4P8XMQ0_9BACL|nr:PadR family transcriptional regulator [Paenibacillus algicola]QCT03713.1 transcriptional regulator, PadR-like family protein [Paenibacillus algicola]
MSVPIHNSDLIRGSIDMLILNLLSEKDNYGYQIIKEMLVRSHHQFELKEPTLYSSLKRLEKQSLIISYWGEESQGGRRKYYRLTGDGEKRLSQSREEWVAARDVIDLLIEKPRREGGSGL